MAAQPWAHPGGHPKQLCVWDESTSEIASCQAPPWGGLPAAVDSRCQGGRESPAPCAHRLPSGQQEGASKAPEMCLGPGQPLTCWGWQPAWGLETWPTKLPSSCLAEAWLGQGAQRLEVEGIQSGSTDAGWRSWLHRARRDQERAGQLQQRCAGENSHSAATGGGIGKVSPKLPKRKVQVGYGSGCMQGIWGSKERGAERLGSRHDAG